MNSDDRRSRLTVTITLGLVLTLGLSAPSQASIVRTTLPELADSCEHAVTGTVRSVESWWDADRTRIYTTIEIEVAEDFKGNVPADGILTLNELGGAVGETTMLVEHAPSFALGEEVLVFTEYVPDGRLIVLGRTQGRVTLKSSGDPAMRSAPQGTIAYTANAHRTVDQVRRLMIERGYTPVRLAPDGGQAVVAKAPSVEQLRPVVLGEVEVEATALPDNTAYAGLNAGDGGRGGRACSGALVYSNTGGSSYYHPGAGTAIGDDLQLVGGGYDLTCYDLSTYSPSGTGSYNVTAALYTDCPENGGTEIAGTSSTWTGVPDGGVYLLYNTLSSPVTLPDTVWMVVTFSTTDAGWVIGGTAETGSTADRFYLPGSCWYWFSGDPYAGFRANLFYTPGGYCSASGGCDEYISRVQVGSIDNSSSCSGYADYTALSTSMQIGTGYPITVTIGNAHSSDVGGLWVDWNRDQDFYDADETITTSWSGTGPYTTAITPPAGASPGSTRMRIRLCYGCTLDPCGDTSWGEVEDYTVTVQAGPAPQITNVNPDHAPAGIGSAGPLITVTGGNFGAAQGSSDYMCFWEEGSTYLVATVVSWSDTQIECYVPAGASSKDCVVVVDYGGGGEAWSNFYPFEVDWSFWYRWQDESVMPIGYYINQNGSDDFSGGEEFTAIHNSLDTWEDVFDCYAFYDYLGTTTATATNNDGYNVMSWTESGWGHGSGVIGVSTIWLSSGIIIETDLEINGQEFTYTAGGVVPGQVDVQNLATHENGHGYMGLSDLKGVADAEKTMYGYLDVTNGESKKRTLESEDIAGAQWICPYTEHCNVCGTYDFGTYYPASSYATHGPISLDGDGCRWYELYLDQYTQYRFSVCEGGGSYSGDTVFELWDSSCSSQVAYNDDYCGPGSQIDYVPVTSDYYYLVVRPLGHPSGSALKYELAYRYIPGSCNTYNDPDYSITATTSYQTHSSTIHRDGCKQYEVSMTGGKPYRFTFCEGGGTADYDTYLTLYDSGGGQVAYNDNYCGLLSQLDYDCLSSGTYYLEVNSCCTGGSGGNYTLAYRRGECYENAGCNDEDPCTDDLCNNPGIDSSCSNTPNNPATPTNASASPPTICPGGWDSSTLTASVSGAVIDWYTGSCGGTYVDTGDSIVVTPTATTTYYVQARDSATGCVSSGCDSVTVTVEDNTGPVVTCNNSDFDLDADAGGCDATLTWNAAAASDDCDGDLSGSVVYDIDLDNNGSVEVAGYTATTYTFPGGTHKVTAKVSDSSGNPGSCYFLVTVSDQNQVAADIELLTVNEAALTRCIAFELIDCDGDTKVVTKDVTLTNGVATDVSFTVDCGLYDCISARDHLHTLKRLDGTDFQVSGTQYVADFTTIGGDGDDSLIGGNLNDDPYVDIMDFVYYVNHYNTDYGSGDTPCSYSPPGGIHADISGDGLVLTADFTFIQAHFLAAAEDDCCGLRLLVGGDGPRTAISVDELIDLGLGHLAGADLNHDGMIDQFDVAAFANGARPPRPIDPNAINVSEPASAEVQAEPEEVHRP